MYVDMLISQSLLLYRVDMRHTSIVKVSMEEIRIYQVVVLQYWKNDLFIRKMSSNFIRLRKSTIYPGSQNTRADVMILIQKCPTIQTIKTVKVTISSHRLILNICIFTSLKSTKQQNQIQNCSPVSKWVQESLRRLQVIWITKLTGECARLTHLEPVSAVLAKNMASLNRDFYTFMHDFRYQSYTEIDVWTSTLLQHRG